MRILLLLVIVLAACRTPEAGLPGAQPGSSLVTVQLTETRFAVMTDVSVYCDGAYIGRLVAMAGSVSLVVEKAYGNYTFTASGTSTHTKSGSSSPASYFSSLTVNGATELVAWGY